MRYSAPFDKDLTISRLSSAKRHGPLATFRGVDLTDFRTLVEAGESETLELKKSSGQRKRAAQTVCAMLNGSGGRVVFGVTPDSRRLIGQDVSERTLEEISQELRGIEPFMSIAPERVPLESGKSLILLDVPGGIDGPYRYGGRPYVRQGSETVPMPQAHYERLLYERMHPTRRWELQPAVGFAIEDLAADEITRTVDEAIRRGRLGEPGTRDPEEILRHLKLTDPAGAVLNGAAALFARPNTLLPHFPQCLLRLAHFRGTTTDQFLDNQQLRGNVFDLLDRATQFLRDRLPVAGRIVPDLFERVDDPLYPPEALREALANAFCHRDYSAGGGSVSVAIFDDRLEVVSTGRLPFGQTVEDLQTTHTSQPWNPLIANVLYMRGVIEQWGRGTLKIVELTRRAELRPATFESGGNTVTVRFHAQRDLAFERMSPTQQSVLTALRAHGAALALAEIVTEVNEGVSERTIQKALQELRELGYVELRGRGRGSRWLVRDFNPENSA